MYYRDQFISTILFLIESYLAFVLRAAIACRCCTIKPHTGKSRCRQYKFQKSCTHTHLHPCIHDASGQRDAAEQIAADRLPVFQRKDTDGIRAGSSQ